MKLSSLLVVLAAAVPSALAAENATAYGAGLVAALNSAGLDALATLLNSTNATAWYQALQQGNHTIFAPNDDALVNATDALASGSVNITALLEYHVAAGVVNTTALNETETIIRSTLTGAPAVLLPANQAQVLVISKLSNGTIYLDNAGTNVTLSQNSTYSNLQIWQIDHVLTPPQNLSTVVANTPQIASLVGATEQALPGFVGNLTETRGLTLFAPTNDAVTAAASALASYNTTQATHLFLNHIINGTALYAPQITNGLNITGAGGEPLTFTVNSTGTWVTSGSSSAQIIHPNILTSNGVIHLIDNVLLNTANNAAAASSAAASLSSSEAHNTGTQTGAVSPTHTGGAISTLQVALPFKLLCTILAGIFLGASLL